MFKPPVLNAPPSKAIPATNFDDFYLNFHVLSFTPYLFLDTFDLDPPSFWAYGSAAKETSVTAKAFAELLADASENWDR
jgi:hypothetical protein